MVSWGKAVEANSSQKAKMRKDSYIHILEDSELCLGSYCFCGDTNKR